ncbi:hypothetical protein NE237_009833 [Protea cynaroides]|uniref:Cytochrome b5 heme-binding domain-containing protein n=1 Tax=Protea cynaroides TaxID=273540 RepID=A0A9Q0KYF4_9MAGN|nr:hypothetical protein NE237_009833 [Protea cynaroides]
MALHSIITDAIMSYTGLSPAAFFTILALMIGVYRLICGMFVAPEEGVKPQEKSFNPMEMPVVAKPVQVGEITEEELRAYDGSDPKKPLLMAIKGQIYDVSMSRMFYGPGGPYAMFAGRDASRALALMSFDPQDLTGNVEGLEPDEIEVLQDWEYKFMEKYVKVGKLVSEKGKDSGNEDKVEGNQDQEPRRQTENPNQDSISGDKTEENHYRELEVKTEENDSQDPEKGVKKEVNQGQDPKRETEKNLLDQDSRNGDETKGYGYVEAKRETVTYIQDLKIQDETEENQDQEPKRETEENLDQDSSNGDETKGHGDAEPKREKNDSHPRS